MSPRGLRAPRGLCLAACCAAACWAAGQPARRLDAGDPRVRVLRYAGLEAGASMGSAAAPYGLRDLALLAGRIDRGLLSPSSARALDRALERLVPDRGGPDEARFRLAAEASPEVYLRRDGALGLPSAFGWTARRPLVALPLDASLGGLYARAVLELREDHNLLDPGLAAVPADVSNAPESMDYIDYTFPFEAYVGFEEGPLSGSLGRDSLRWGPGRTGTLFLSDAPDYYDYAELAYTGSSIAYRVHASSSDPSLLPAEAPGGAGLDYGDYLGWSKYLFAHRLDLSFGGRIAFAAVEATTLGGIEPDLSYLNPFAVFHNKWGWNNPALPMAASSLLSVEARILPWRYAEVYGAFAMNQFQSPYELSRFGPDAETLPNAFGWLAGLECAYPAFGGWLRGAFEYAYTNPWLYVRETRLNSYSVRRYLPSNVPGARLGFHDAPAGYAYGPDAIVYFGELGYDAPGALSLGASLEHLVKGEQGLRTPYAAGPAAVALATPTGTPMLRTRLGLSAAWSPLPELSILAEAYVSQVRNAGHVPGKDGLDLEGRLGLIYAVAIEFGG